MRLPRHHFMMMMKASCPRQADVISLEGKISQHRRRGSRTLRCTSAFRALFMHYKMLI